MDEILNLIESVSEGFPSEGFPSYFFLDLTAAGVECKSRLSVADI